jgi:hypothetical protein
VRVSFIFGKRGKQAQAPLVPGCAAKPAVIAVMPASDRRPHPTELLLCEHHYRASQSARTAAGATVLHMNGSRVVESGRWALT